MHTAHVVRLIAFVDGTGDLVTDRTRVAMFHNQEMDFANAIGFAEVRSRAEQLTVIVETIGFD